MIGFGQLGHSFTSLVGWVEEQNPTNFLIVYRVLQMRGAGHADDLVDLQVPGKKAHGVPCERLQKSYFLSYHVPPF